MYILLHFSLCLQIFLKLCNFPHIFHKWLSENFYIRNFWVFCVLNFVKMTILKWRNALCDHILELLYLFLIELNSHVLHNFNQWKPCLRKMKVLVSSCQFSPIYFGKAHQKIILICKRKHCNFAGAKE